MPNYNKKHHKASSKIAMLFRRRRLKKRVDARQNAKIARLQRIVNSQLERKWIDDSSPATSITSGGSLTQSLINLENIYATGATVGGTTIIPSSHTTRLGNKISLKKLTVKFHQVNSNTDLYNNIRVIFFILPDPDNIALGTPAVTDILETADWQSFYKKNSKFKYRILYDKTTTTGGWSDTVNTSLSAGVGIPVAKNYTMTMTWKKGLPVHYKDEQANNPIKNQLWFLFISDSSAPNHPSIQTHSRLHFDP